MTLVGQAQQTLFVSPVNGTSPIDAAEVLANDEALRAKHNTHDNDATIHIQSSVAASRPGAGTAGRVWLSSDTLTLAYDNGVSWSSLAYAASVHTHVWSDITSGKPTTLSGYGITDAVTSVTPVTSGSGTHTGGKVTLAATAAGYASLNLPHGTAPSSPANGDVWTTTAGAYARINGTTVGPLIGSGTAVSLTTLTLTGTGPVIDGSTGTFTSTPAVKLPSAADVAVSVRSSSGSVASLGTTTITWTSEYADPKSLSSVGGGSTTNAFGSGSYGGLWLVMVRFGALYTSGIDATGYLTITGSIAGNIRLMADNSAEHRDQTYFAICRLSDSTNLTCAITMDSGDNTTFWTLADLTAVRIW